MFVETNFRAVPKIIQGISSSHIRLGRPKLSLVQICSHFFNSVGSGSQKQFFDALQWGKWQAGRLVLSAEDMI